MCGGNIARMKFRWNEDKIVFMGSDRNREWSPLSGQGDVWVASVLEAPRNRADWWIIVIWPATHFSSFACQTVYMGSGLPTRKSVLNHSMTSHFCLLYKHKLKH